MTTKPKARDRFGILLGLLAGLLVSGGCGPAKAYPVRGSVVGVRGELKSGEVHFQSVNDASVVGSGGIDKNGKFRIKSATYGDGLPPGQYRIAVKSPSVAARFADFNTSDLMQTVRAQDENYFDIIIPATGKN